MLSAAQRAARETRIGASEVAALMDEHPFTTPLDIYRRIVLGESRQATQNMAVGAALEPAVLSLARDLLGLRLRACSRPYIHRWLPLTASPDAYLGAHELAEVKVTSAFNVGLPRYVWWQVQTQMFLTGRHRCTVIVLAGASLLTHVVDADASAWDTLCTEVDLFERAHLIPRIPPVEAPFTFKETAHV